MRIDAFFEKLTDYSIYVMVIFFSVSKAMIEISFTVALVSWLILKIARRECPKITWDTSFLFLSLFVLLSALSALVSHYPAQSVRGIGKVLEETFLFLIIVDRFQEPAKIRKLIGIGFAVLLATSLDAVYQYGFGKDLLRGRPFYFTDVHVRLIGPFNDHAVFATYILGWSPLLLALLLNRTSLSRRDNLLLGLILVLSMFCLFHTQARGAWCAFALAAAFFSVIQRQKLLTVFVAAAVLIGVAVLPRNMIIHVDREGKEQSLIERYVLWERAWNVVKARPLLGTGINTYVKGYHQFDTRKSWRVENYYAHNSYLQLAAERGLPALLFLAAFIVSFYGKCFRSIREFRENLDPVALLKGLMTALAALLTMALVDTVFEPLQLGMLVWFLLGVAFAGLEGLGRRKEACA